MSKLKFKIMTKFIFSFLVAFNDPEIKKARLTVDKPETESLRRWKLLKKCLGKKGSVNTPKIAQDKPTKRVKDNSENELTDPRILEASKPEYFYHIEYTIIPGRFEYKADIVFCGKVAKIYADCGQQAQRTTKRGELFWCLFTLQHDLNLSNADILYLHSHQVEFKVFPVRGIISKKARMCRAGTYYLHPENKSTKVLFAPAYKKDPLVSDTNKIEKEIQSNIWYQFLVGARSNEVFSKIDANIGYNHRLKGVKYLNRIEENLDPAPHRAKSIPSKKLPVPKCGRFECAQVSFRGEMFFTDHKDLLMEVNSKSIPAVYILTTVEGLLTAEQRLYFNPVVISMSKISNLPTRNLLDQGFKKIYLKYEFPPFGSIITNQYQLSNKIEINESRAFLTHNCDKLRLINFLQSGRVNIQIRGIQSSVSLPPNQCLFSSRFIDNQINKPFTPEVKRLYQRPKIRTDQLICIAPVPFLMSIYTSWSYVDTQPCFSSIFDFKNYNPSRKCLNTVDINFSDHSNPLGVIPTEDLIDYNTTLEYQISLYAGLQHSLMSILGTNEPYSRVVLVLDDEKIANQLYSYVIAYNNNYKHCENRGQKNLWRNCYNFKPIYAQEELHQMIEKQIISPRILTGFYVNCGYKFVLYFEGQSSGINQVIWHKIMDWSDKEIYFNSDHIFKERLYFQLLPCIAVFPIILRYPIEMILSINLTHLTGSMPIPAQKALQKLNLLLIDSSFKATCKNGLFPTMMELMSLSIGFGVPLQYNENMQLVDVVDEVKSEQKIIVKLNNEKRISFQDDFY